MKNIYQEQPRSKKPPMAQVSANTAYLKPTIGHEMRKSFEVVPNSESSKIFVQKAEQKFREECTF